MQGSRAVDLVPEHLKCDLFFGPGNHEDHSFLENTVNYYSWCLGSPCRLIAIGKGQARDCKTGRSLPQGPVVSLAGVVGPGQRPECDIRHRLANGLPTCTTPQVFEAASPIPTDIMLAHCPTCHLLGAAPSKLLPWNS